MTLKSYLLAAALIIAGCASELIDADKVVTQTTTKPEQYNNRMPGRLNVRLTPEMGEHFRVVPTRNGLLDCGNDEMNHYLRSIGAKEMKPIFPHGGKYEERHRKAGLHLWYEIIFDEKVPLSRADDEAANVQGIAYVEPVPVLRHPVYRAITSTTTATSRAVGSPFDDPELNRQWHYRNNGSLSFAKSGSDINLFEAWETETGKPTVIVNVVDEGVDYRHEDLKDNIWVNTAELNGQQGEDDDDNGFVDDVYGYNFVVGYVGGKLYTTSEHASHGTHVAGTIAAVNNNGIGVCGVAGGSGKGGVRIMNSQIFMDLPKEEDEGAYIPSAIVYGADNGAVISQNSWGDTYKEQMGEMPKVLKDAIDYFVKYAGCDNDGNQLPDSPMKGGVVIFAAGNDPVEYNSLPSAYKNVIAVAASGPDFKMSWYTTYGDWVDIIAPGGDQRTHTSLNAGIYSTLPDNQYGWMQGTSMACPHVSGVAALIVSKFGGQGFTNDDLKARLLTALRPYDAEELNDKKYKGKIGRGYIDAARALDAVGESAPEAITAASLKAGITDVEVKWKAVADKDVQDKTANTYRIYYSTSPLTTESLKHATYVEVAGYFHQPGDDLNATISKLDEQTTYHIGIVAIDRWGNTSTPYMTTATTKENEAPEVKIVNKETTYLNAEGKISLTAGQEAIVDFSISDPEGHDWSVELKGDITAVRMNRTRTGIQLQIPAINAPGNYMISIVVKDEYGKTTTVNLPYYIYKNHAPSVVRIPDKQMVAIEERQTVDISDLFRDPDGNSMTYTARAEDASIVALHVNGTKLEIIGMSKGNTSIELTATDSNRASNRLQFSVQVFDNTLVYALYPIPAQNELNLHFSNTVSSGTISIYNVAGNKVMEQPITVNASTGNKMKMDVSALAGGTYILQANANGKQFRKTFLKL